MDALNEARSVIQRLYSRKAAVLEYLLLSTITQEPLLLVGPPGTAKSDLAIKWVEALGVPSEAYFEYMLTRFTEPAELFGPVDLVSLKEGKYIRKTIGKLPEAQVAFIDEVFKSNSAILNALLTVLNERKFYQDGRPVPVPLEILIAATNEIPDNPELNALKDRFVLRAESTTIWDEEAPPAQADEQFKDLLRLGTSLEFYRYSGQKPWVSHQNLMNAVRTIRAELFRELIGQTHDGNVAKAIDRWLPAPLLRLLVDLLKSLSGEFPDAFRISDRTVIKLFKILVARAIMNKRRQITEEDISVMVPGLAERNFGAIREATQTALHLSA
ncbi:MAG: AAA family ATPase [bacterium JZ-2024 1]